MEVYKSYFSRGEPRLLQIVRYIFRFASPLTRSLSCGKGKRGVDSMEELEDSNRSGNGSDRVRSLLARGQALHEELRAWGGPGTARLQKLVRAELSFLNRLAAIPLLPPASSCPALRSSNFGHLDEVFRILQHPLVNGISAVMQNLAVGDSDTSTVCGRHALASKETAHVDIACMLDGKPVWLILSSRNPRYVRWLDIGKNVKGLRMRLLLLLHAACADAVKQPESIILCFMGQVPEDVDRGLRDEFSAMHVPSFGHKVPSGSSASRDSSKFCLHPDQVSSSLQDCKFSEVEGGEWLNVEVQKYASRWNQAWETYEVYLEYFKEGTRVEVHTGLQEDEARYSNQTVKSKDECTREKDNGVCSSSLPPLAASGQETSLLRSVQSAPDQAQKHRAAADCQKLVNLDTTALVALVSEVSNGGADYLLALPQGDMEKRFPSMSAFIREQALSELDNPLAPEIEEAIACRQPIISQYVYDEFSSIISQIGGSKEKDRARNLLQRIRVVPNTPSNRVMSLPPSGRIKRRHKIVFGTGDFLNAPTLTANMAFVRAAHEKGLLIAILEHRPRALIGD